MQKIAEMHQIDMPVLLLCCGAHCWNASEIHAKTDIARLKDCFVDDLE